MKEETYVVEVEGYIIVPVTQKIKVTVGESCSKEVIIQKAMEKLDSVLNEETVRKVEVTLTTFSDRKVQVQSDDVMLEWESIRLKDKAVKAKKGNAPEEDG